MSLHLPVSFHPGVRFLISNGVGRSEVVAKLVMAIESRKIDSGFGIGRGRSINGREKIVDSDTLRCMTVISGWMLKDGREKELKEYFAWIRRFPRGYVAQVNEVEKI